MSTEQEHPSPVDNDISSTGDAVVAEPATEAPTIDETIADMIVKLHQELAALPDPDYFRHRAIDALTRRNLVEGRIEMIRRSRATIAGLDPQIEGDTEWRDFLIAWRKKLCDELLALPKRIYDVRTLGVQQNLNLSIKTIDLGRLSEDCGWCLENLRLGQLMRDTGYVEGPKIENQVCGRLPFYGSLQEVERRIALAQAERSNAERQLADAMLDDAGRAAQQAEVARKNALPQRKTRGDGSQYDRWPDGREVEATS